MKWFRFPISLETSWQWLSTISVVIVIVGLLVFAKLDTLLPGYSVEEIQSMKSSGSLQTIVSNPINAPYKVVQLIIASVSDNAVLASRLAAGFFGLLTIGLFYFGARQWHSARVAFFTTALFATSGWFLYIARLGTPEILQTMSVLLFATAGFWLAATSHGKLAYALALVALALSMYVPGTIWLILVALAIRGIKDVRIIRNQVSHMQLGIIITSALIFVILPIGWAISQNTSLVLPLLGLPHEIPDGLEFAKSLAFVPLSLVALGGPVSDFWIARLPLLDVFTSLLFILGLYYYFKFRSLDRAKLLVGFMGIATVLIALNASITMAYLLPAVYVCVAGGVALLIGQWHTVFPKNPIAQTVGIVLITLAIAVSIMFNLRAYFVAWPNTTKTEATFSRNAEI